MYAARQPMLTPALMHGCTPVSGRQFNRSYNDSNNVPHLSSFTTRRSHPALTPSATTGQSHGFVPNNGRLRPPLRHNGQGYGQSGASSAKVQMSENQYSHSTEPDACLADSLLCSPWPPLPVLEPSPHPAAATLPDLPAVAEQARSQPVQLPVPDSTFPPLELIISSSSTSQNDPTPGLTPTSSVRSTPATSVGRGGDETLAKLPHRLLQQGLNGYRHIQPKPAELSSAVLETRSSTDLALSSTAPPGNAPNTISPFEEFPEWPPNTTWDFQWNEVPDLLQFEDADFEGPTSLAEGFNTIDPAALNGLNNAIDMDAFAGLDNGLLDAYPDMTKDFGPYSVLANGDPSFGISQSLSDPFMPSLPLDNDGMGMGGFDNRTYTGNLGADNMTLLAEPFPQTASTVVSTMQGEGSRRNTARDDELVELRAKGLSYRDIKQLYNFDVAESTLRGRMRSLTKKKEERVRKPTWKADNIRLLCNCVMDFAFQQGLPSEVINPEGLPLLRSEQATNKVSWKRVAKDMAERGSYLYGNATVKKKYMDLRKEQMTRRL